MAESQFKSHEEKVDFDEHVLEDQGPPPVLGPSDGKLDFDDDTLKAIAEVYQEEGDKEFIREEVRNAVEFYTEGIQVNCKDVQLNAKLYSNRATAYYHLENFHEALNDATDAIKLEPTLMKAIEIGARACDHLLWYEESISWCDKGLAIEKSRRTLLDLRARCVVGQNKLEEAKRATKTHSVKGQNLLDSEVGERAGEDASYTYLGNAYHRLGDFKKAIEHYELDLKIAKEVGDRAGEGVLYGDLGNAYRSLRDFKTAIKYYELHLKMAQELGDRAGEGKSYGNLGNAYDSLGDFKKAIEYHEVDLKIAKELGDRAGEGRSYGNLGNAYDSLGDFKKAIEYHKLDLEIAKEVGDRAEEGKSYGNLGNAYDSLGDFKKAIEYHEVDLQIAKELGDRAGEGRSYGNLGNAYDSLGDFKKAIEYHELDLEIAKEMGDRAGEGKSYANLGNAYDSLGDFKKAIEYHERDLEIAKEVRDRAGEGKSYCNLGNVYDSLGDFKKAIEYHELDLKIAKEVGDRAGEGKSYGNLGNAYQSLGDFQTAIQYHELDLKIAKEVGDRAGEGASYGNLGNAYDSLGDFKKAIDYHEKDLKIAKEVGDRAGEGKSYGNLGNAYHSLGDFQKALEYYELDLKIAKEVGDRAGEGASYGNLGNTYDSLGDDERAIEYDKMDLQIAKEVGDKVGSAISHCKLGRSFETKEKLDRALDCYLSCVKMLNDVRECLQGKEEWTINYRHISNIAYTKLWYLMLKRGEVVKALFAADEGRAQALKDLLNSKYESETSQTAEETTCDKLRFLQSNAVFLALHEREIVFWVIKNGKDVHLRRKEISDHNSKENATTVLESLIDIARKDIGVRSPLNIKSDGDLSKKQDEAISQPTHFGTNPFRTWYDLVISPIRDLIDGNELIFVPEGPLCLAPYAAFMDSNSKYLSETFRIRVIPSLNSLKLIKDCSPDYHHKSGSLLVGNPCYEYIGLEMLYPLPCAKEEVEMIGKILETTPLTGKEATKDEVLKRLSTVDLVHIAAHGRMETGEIYLAPNPKLASQTPVEEDLLLRKSDVVRVQMSARLVVLSCCYSGRGEIKAEGVVGIARAFLGAGARSVLVSLWAIDDEATLKFMESFYRHLKEGKSASESLNQAMKCLRESERFSKVKYWAPFVLIGDDVTLDLAKGD